MNPIYSGAATLLAGTVAFSFFRFRTSDPTIENFLKETRQLSPSGKASLEEVCDNYDPSGNAVSLSKGDIQGILWNSRLWVCIANRARLCEPDDQELAASFHIIHKQHAKLRWFVLLAIIEQIVGKLGLGRVTMYHRMILWTYGVELELLEQISKKCGIEGPALQAIL
jgi:hypothetical protein